MPNVFIGMETSGQLRDRFIAQGHSVVSCDLLPADDPSRHHIQGDVFEVLEFLKDLGWWPDLAIFHPDCTYLTASAAWAFNDPDYERFPGSGYHQKVAEGTLVGAARRRERERGHFLPSGALKPCRSVALPTKTPLAVPSIPGSENRIKSSSPTSSVTTPARRPASGSRTYRLCRLTSINGSLRRCAPTVSAIGVTSLTPGKTGSRQAMTAGRFAARPMTASRTRLWPSGARFYGKRR